MRLSRLSILPFAIVVSAAGMAFTMPGCPDTKAMQQQIDSLELTNKQLSAKIQALGADVTATKNALTEQKGIFDQVGATIKEQGAALAKLDDRVKTIETRPVPTPAPAAKAKPAAKGKAKHK